MDFEYPYRVTWLFPEELKYEKILMDNISNSKKYLQDYCYRLEQVNESQKVLSTLKFDIQKEKQKEILKSNIKSFNEVKEKINENISPYHWEIIQDVHDLEGYCFGEPVIADYVLFLERNSNYDE